MPGSFLTSDLAALLNSSDFGEASGVATFKGTSVPGIFDDEDVEVQMGEGVTQIIHQPMFTGRSADFTGIVVDDPMVIRGETFRVTNWQDDGTGMIEIHLERT